MPQIIVQKGESLPSIARDHGFFWQSIWDRSENASLKQKRENPNVLFQGDEVFIPEKELKETSVPTEAHHKFKRKGEEHKLKLQLKLLGKPRKNESYVLFIDGKSIRGKTDGDGKIEHPIPADAREGKLVLRDGKESYPLRFDHLDPLDTVSGVQQRLSNLGFACNSDSGELDEPTQDALQAFQAKQGLQVTGEIDEPTKSALKKLHP